MGLLEGRVVIVTGGANGIGRECALIAAQQGAKVVVNDLGGSVTGVGEGSANAAEAVAKEIREAGGSAIANSDSITSLKAVEDMVQDALKNFGALHAVINTAGILRDSMFHKMSEDDWDRVVEVHLRGSFNICRATIEHFREQRDGAYALFTSGSGLVGNVGQANYGAAKMGIVGLSRIVAMEGASRNVRSNCISPIAWTRMVQTVPVKDEAGAARMKNLAQTLRPEQPARLAVALVSDAVKYVSGQIFGSRGSQLTLISQPRAIETFTQPQGWSVEDIVNEVLPKMKANFFSMPQQASPSK